MLTLDKVNENFHRQSFSVTIPVLDFHRRAKIQKKTKEQFLSRTGYRRLDGWTDRRVERQLEIHRTYISRPKVLPYQ